MQRIHSDDSAIESQIQAKGKTAPRITPADIEATIASEHYFNASNCAMHPKSVSSIDFMLAENFNATKAAIKSLELLTFCVLVLKNGFTVTGESACASPENFDAEIGRNIARTNAVNKIWPLLGFRLRDKITWAQEQHDMLNPIDPV